MKHNYNLIDGSQRAQLSCWALTAIFFSKNNCQNRLYRYDDFKSSCIGNFFIRIIFPFLHLGQQLISMPVNRSIIWWMLSLIFSGRIASASMSFLMMGMSCFLFLWAKKPKYRILQKPIGRTCSKNRRMNSWALRVICLISLSLCLSL